MLLESLGHRCALANTGKRALELASALRPEIALIDLTMPDVSGFDIARALRGTATYCVAATGHTGPEHRARAFAAGFADYLVKPYEMATIAKVIARGIRCASKRASVLPLAVHG